MSVVGKPKGAAELANRDPNEVPADYGIAAAIPRELDVSLSFRLEYVEVRETLTVEREHAVSNPMAAVAQLLGKRSDLLPPPPPRIYLVRGRSVVARWEMRAPPCDVTIMGETVLEGVTFDPDGKPNDSAKWADAVRELTVAATEDARARVEELIDKGLDAERREEAAANEARSKA